MQKSQKYLFDHIINKKIFVHFKLTFVFFLFSDLRSFIQDLEQQLNAYLATALRFTHVQQAIPLQDFKDHKATMDLCAFVFLVGKPSADIGVKISSMFCSLPKEVETYMCQL